MKNNKGISVLFATAKSMEGETYAFVLSSDEGHRLRHTFKLDLYNFDELKNKDITNERTLNYSNENKIVCNLSKGFALGKIPLEVLKDLQTTIRPVAYSTFWDKLYSGYRYLRILNRRTGEVCKVQEVNMDIENLTAQIGKDSEIILDKVGFQELFAKYTVQEMELNPDDTIWKDISEMKYLELYKPSDFMAIRSRYYFDNLNFRKLQFRYILYLLSVKYTKVVKNLGIKTTVEVLDLSLLPVDGSKLSKDTKDKLEVEVENIVSAGVMPRSIKKLYAQYLDLYIESVIESVMYLYHAKL